MNSPCRMRSHEICRVNRFQGSRSITAGTIIRNPEFRRCIRSRDMMIIALSHGSGEIFDQYQELFGAVSNLTYFPLAEALAIDLLPLTTNLI